MKMLPLTEVKKNSLFITVKNEVVIFNSEIYKYLIIVKYNSMSFK